jgi:phosphate starvation-inducible PhoH-like protein
MSSIFILKAWGINLDRDKEKTINYDIQLNDEQREAKEQILLHPFSFLIGKAGSGKTLTAAAIALDQLFKKNIKKIVITRPTVSTEDNGFLPGSLEEKMEPWLVPIRDNFRKVYNKKDILEKLEKDEKIEIVPLTFFRGRTFENAICIIDEAQNLNRSQLQMCLGRLGQDSLMIFCGDYQQIDLKKKVDSAIHDIEILKNSRFVYVKELKQNHRHPAVFEVLELLNKE